MHFKAILYSVLNEMYFYHHVLVLAPITKSLALPLASRKYKRFDLLEIQAKPTNCRDCMAKIP